jgi:hypothetical protein
MVFLREYFAAWFKHASADPVAQEPARATGLGFVELPLSEECRRALQTQAPQRVAEILDGIDMRSSRLTSMAGFDKEDRPAGMHGACMEIGPA